MPNLQRLPDPFIAGCVHSLWLRERDFRPPNDTFDVYPDSFVELIWSFGAACSISDQHGVRALPSAYVVSLLSTPFRLQAHGRLTTIGVRLYAWGFAALFGGAVGRLEQAVRPLDATLQQLAAPLARLVAAGQADAALAYVDAHLVAWARAMPLPPPAAKAAAHALRQPARTDRVAALAAASALSPRQLERTVTAMAGVSPKALLRRQRFEHVRDALWQQPQADLATLAAEHGYADQAHFTREFKQFSRRTPRQFAAEMAAAQSLLRAQDVAIVQDRAASGCDTGARQHELPDAAGGAG